MLSSKLGVEQVANEFKDKRVLMRVDFNVPIKDGKVVDVRRISSTIPTIKYILSCHPKALILMSHCGRPNGMRKLEYSLNIIVPALEEELKKNNINKSVLFIKDCVGDEAYQATINAKNGQIILLENLRFHVEEEGKGENEKGDKVKATDKQIQDFRQALTKLGDVYVNDAFGTAHRAHSSVVGIDLKTRVAGLLMKKELDYFSKVLENPQKPVLAILGGAKVKDKIQLILNLLDKVDMMIIGGGMAFTFKKVLENMSIGSSLYDEEGASIVKDIINKAKEKGVKIYLPTDFVIANKFDNEAERKTVSDKEGIPQNWMGLDVGPKTIEQAKEVINQAKTIVWNGPPGVFEMPNFACGSLAFAAAVAAATAAGAISIVGGGDTASLVEKASLANQFSHVSTGGGASLELLEGKILPGVQSLTSK